MAQEGERAKQAGAGRIFAIDVNPAKFELAVQLGATECIDPTELAQPMQSVLLQRTQWGVDYTFDCTGNTEVRLGVRARARGRAAPR